VILDLGNIRLDTFCDIRLRSYKLKTITPKIRIRMAFIQWNVNGFTIRKDEIKLLVSLFNPICLSLQETHFKPSDSPVFRGFTFYRKDDLTGNRVAGGVATLVSDEYFSSSVPLTTPFQAVAVRVHLPRPVTFCNIYFPEWAPVTRYNLDNLVAQLPHPFFLLGDFNAHNPLWGDSMQDGGRGRCLEQFFDDHNLIILNNGQMTRFNSFNGVFSAIDLCVCSPSLSTLFELTVHTDLCGSDHFPIILKLLENQQIHGRPPQWNLRRANWKRFTGLADLTEAANLHSVEEKVKTITDALVAAAEGSIPTSPSTMRRIPVPWWTPACKEALQTRKRALRSFSKRPSPANLEAFRLARAKARRTFREAQRKSWQEYVSNINHRTPCKKVWHRIAKIDGKFKGTSIAGIITNGATLTSPDEIANAIGQYFADVSSSQHYSASFQKTKRAAERKQPSFASANTEPYNMPFSRWELEQAIRASKNTAPGHDRVHNSFLKNLSSQSLDHLLDLFNLIWQSQKFPEDWRLAIQVPILKSDKDKTLTSSYRPISLTSCLCKTLERMVNNRLVWWLEKHKLLNNLQSGFRKHRNTLDHLIRIESSIQDAFLLKQHMVAVFFDLEKAYDTTWRFNILTTLASWGFKGNLPTFITSFLTNRRFKVRIGNVLSNDFTQENGVPQGSVLSVTLFAIAINGITRCVQSPVSSSLYVDDLAIFCKAARLSSATRQLQNTVARLARWAEKTGFSFSPTKTKCIHFSRHRSVFPDPEISLKNEIIPVCETVKFLGLVFDQKLNWKAHIAQLRIQCFKSLNLLRYLTGTKWGADRTVMLRVYRALIRSKLDYGCAVYDSARQSYKKSLNTIHNSGIRLATGALRTSRVESLYCESSEPPLNLRRQYLLASYASKVLCMRRHPTYQPLWNPRFQALYDARPNATLPAGIRLNQLMVDASFHLPVVYPMGIGTTAPWVTGRPTILTGLMSNSKSTTSTLVYRKRFAEICCDYKDFVQIFTDGSKVSNAVGSAFISGSNISHGFKLNSQASIVTAELYALLQALTHVVSHREEKAFLVCSDSFSSLQAIDTLYSPHTLVQGIHSLLASLSTKGVRVVFCWVPGHVGIQGNELADVAAKAATEKDFIHNDRLPFNDLKNIFKSLFKKKFQDLWEMENNNKLKEVKGSINPWDSSIRPTRREEVVLTRLRIGHTLFSHAYLFSQDKIPPRCDTCNEVQSVRHLLVECTTHRDLRRRLSLENTISKVLGDDSKQIDKLFKFLIQIDMLKMI
jgi:ribonuclease HI